MIFTKKNGLEDEIIEKTNRGVTLWDGKGGYTKGETNILISVISQYEIQELKKVVEDFDEDTFTIVNEREHVLGNYERRLV